MEFKDYLSNEERSLVESAALKLELVNRINSLMGGAEIADLRKIVKILEKQEQE